MHMRYKKGTVPLALLLALSATRASAINLPNPLGVGTVHDLLNKIIDGLMLFSVPIVVGVIVWGAYLIMFGGANEENIEKGKHAILYAVVGYGIILLAKGIELIIRDFFR